VSEPEVRRVIAAWTSPGPVPEYHAQWVERLRREWPTLANALDALAASPGGV
jgi:hypothetical protein